jgi:hypothetical protein
VTSENFCESEQVDGGEVERMLIISMRTCVLVLLPEDRVQPRTSILKCPQILLREIIS